MKPCEHPFLQRRASNVALYVKIVRSVRVQSSEPAVVFNVYFHFLTSRSVHEKYLSHCKCLCCPIVCFRNKILMASCRQVGRRIAGIYFDSWWKINYVFRRYISLPSCKGIEFYERNCSVYFCVSIAGATYIN